MDQLRRLSQAIQLELTGKWILLSAVVGLIAGLAAIAFQRLSHFVQLMTLVRFSGYVPPEAAGEHFVSTSPVAAFSPGMLLVVITAGGLISGWLVYYFAPEAEGHGTDAVIDSFHNQRGRIRARVPLVKALASAITIGTGGSAGREGPIAQIGAGISSSLASWLGLSDRDRRIMLAAGMAAGIGAIFRAPLAAALFAGEILYRDPDIDSDVIVPSAMSSIVSYTVYSWSLPPARRFSPLFGETLQFQIDSTAELIPYAVLAVVLAIVSAFYIRVFYGTQAVMRLIPIPVYLRPALGAFAAGALGVTLYMLFDRDKTVLAVLSTGYGILQQTLQQDVEIGIAVLAAVVLVKILTTSLTISSGGSGGVFGPSMVIGGCAGAAVGQCFYRWWPTLVTHPQAYTIVGMAGFFAGAARAPISTIIMVSEITSNYHLLLPTLLVATLCYLLGSHDTLYRKQVRTRIESPAHHGDFVIDVLEGIKVSDVYQRGLNLTKIPEGMTLKAIVHSLTMSTQRYFPVVDADDNMVGIFSAEDVRSYLYDEAIWQLAVARDVMTTRIVTVTGPEDLNSALRKFTALNVDELPVVTEDGVTLQGMLRRKEAIATYNRRLMEHKQGNHTPGL
jgi:CIC family chloride channel protein